MHGTLRMKSPGTPTSLPTQRRCLAFPVFKGRVAPILDTCTRLVVMDPQGALASGHKVRVAAGPPAERVLEFRQLGIRIIVCGALSEQLYNLLLGEGIRLVSGVAGDLEAVVAAFKDGTLAQPCFRMPGAAAPPGEPDAP